MGNIVAYAARPELPPINMPNGLTSVFVSALALAASLCAQSDSERHLAVWIASHDQGVFGAGMVGFDVADMPWRPEALEPDRQFLLRVIDAALAGQGWDRLGYAPRQETLLPCLERFRTMVSEFSGEHVVAQEPMQAVDDPAGVPFELCAQHGVYLHELGCIVCNDA